MPEQAYQAGHLPGAAWWNAGLQGSYEAILGSTPKILAASFAAAFGEARVTTFSASAGAQVRFDLP